MEDMDPHGRIEELMRLRDEIRQQIERREGDELDLRLRLVLLAQAINELEEG